MSFSKEILTQVAHLARLPSDNIRDNPSIQQDFDNIVQMIDQIQAIATDALPPMAHPLEMSQPLRPDIITEPNDRDNLIKLAPQAEAGLYLVPLVIEEDT